MTAEEIKSLFKPFHRVNSVEHRKRPGTGLGLALSLKLAQLHGGNITVTSEPNQGSCFTLSLPN
jgi:signal transduction histidine kinase